MSGIPLKWAPEMLDALRELRAQGEPLVICAERIGVDYKTAVRKARVLGLNARMNFGRKSGVQMVREASAR